MAVELERPVLLFSGGKDSAVLMMEILRVATAGSVDDGKSTLIGRLLYDSEAILSDQLEAVEPGQPGQGRRLSQPRPAHRRPAGRA